MDPKMIEMNNLRVLNDYLNQTIDVLSRQPRTPTPGFGFSPFSSTPMPVTPGTDTVFGPWSPQPMQQTFTPFGGPIPFTGYGPSFGPQGSWPQGFGPMMSGPQGFGPQGFGPQSWPQGFGPQGWPQSFGPQGWPQSFGPQSFGPQSFGPQSFGPGWQQPWSPMTEAQRQAQISQAYAAKQQVLEAMCRACGIPV